MNLTEQQHSLAAENFLEIEHSVKHFTNLDHVGEWPDGIRRQPGVCKKPMKDPKNVTVV